MADDKTAADLRDRIANRLELGQANSANYTPDEVLLRQAWQALGHAEDALHAAVRRVAPDQDAIAEVLVEHTRQTLEGRCSCGHTVPLGYSFVKHQAAALLASGVLGVPADQRTADRETIAEAIVAVKLGFAHMAPGPALIYADAVLAVLVPADQVRAEALAEIAVVASGLSSVLLHWRDRLEGWMSAPPFKGNPFRNGAAAFERAAGLARDLGAGKLNTEELDRLAHFGEDGPCTGYDYREMAGA